jgi:predicted enzyme related to lactoylglutathione lyase
MDPLGLRGLRQPFRPARKIRFGRSHFLNELRHGDDVRNSPDEKRRHQLMNHGIRTIIYPVKDAGRAKGLFGKLLGSEPYVDQPYYVGFRVGEQEIGLLPNGHVTGMSGPLAYFHVDDIKKALEVLVKEGAQIQQPVKDVGAGKLVASIKDADGNPIGLLQST